MTIDSGFARLRRSLKLHACSFCLQVLLAATSACAEVGSDVQSANRTEPARNLLSATTRNRSVRTFHIGRRDHGVIASANLWCKLEVYSIATIDGFHDPAANDAMRSLTRSIYETDALYELSERTLVGTAVDNHISIDYPEGCYGSIMFWTSKGDTPNAEPLVIGVRDGRLEVAQDEFGGVDLGNGFLIMTADWAEDERK